MNKNKKRYEQIIKAISDFNNKLMKENNTDFTIFYASVESKREEVRCSTMGLKEDLIRLFVSLMINEEGICDLISESAFIGLVEKGHISQEILEEFLKKNPTPTTKPLSRKDIN